VAVSAEFRHEAGTGARAFRDYDRGGWWVWGAPWGPAPEDALRPFATIAAARGPAGVSLEMPNIKQQKKRVRTAAQERLENLRFRSTAKTLARRLQAAVAEGDEARVTEEHKQLVSWLDRAAARGAIHKNTAARRKSQADRLAAGPRA
jgi:small subunit ribosomal protein S20